MHYLISLRWLLDKYPDLKQAVLRCCHCGIIFLSHKCNRGRADIGCPLGCREHYKAMKSKKRSSEYSKSADGRMKKKRQNASRNNEVADPRQSSPEPEFKESVIEYTRLLIGMTERRKISRDEAVTELRRIVSQRSLDTA